MIYYDDLHHFDICFPWVNFKTLHPELTSLACKLPVSDTMTNTGKKINMEKV